MGIKVSIKDILISIGGKKKKEKKAKKQPKTVKIKKK